jgi:meso-butanediol dehydrogenase / (S,S)-butanediol dehydrogenase / diacetyl reductase
MPAVGPRVVIVTGAATGIGQATSILLAERGWQVIASYNRQPIDWAEGYDSIIPCRADVTTEEGNRRLVDTAESRFGRLDGLVLNAARFTPLPIDAADGMEVLGEILSVNLIGTVIGIRAALPAVRRSGGGSIVVVSSMNGLSGDNRFWAYSASKFALIGLVQSLACELGCENIRVNAACPGPTAGTALTLPLEQLRPEEFRDRQARMPYGRWARPEEQAGPIAFLLSDDSSYLNGISLPIDGGVAAGYLQHPATRQAAPPRQEEPRPAEASRMPA